MKPRVQSDPDQLDRFPDDVLFWAMHIRLEDEQADRHLPFEFVGPDDRHQCEAYGLEQEDRDVPI